MITAEQKAKYIVEMVKQSGKSLEYAIDIISWYSWTDKDDSDIEKLIRQMWNKQ